MTMIHHTPEEKAASKAAKKAWKQKGHDRPAVRKTQNQQKQETEPQAKPILTGLMEDENILPDNYEVYWDRLYVAEFPDGTFHVIASNIKGTVKNLKHQDYSQIAESKPVNIRRCNMSKRNLF